MLDEARSQVPGCIEVSCNRQRLRGALDELPPAGFGKLAAVPE